jgi:hypothetical protein
VQTDRKIAEIAIKSGSNAPAEATSQSCHVSFELDLHGLLRCTGAVHNHKIKEEVVVPAPAPAAAPAAPAAAEAGAENVSSNADGAEPSAMETDAPTAEAAAVATNDVPKGEVKVKTKKVRALFWARRGSL